ncbi:T9SS type A sorting domain-containing protein [Emticicia fluvialis]|uniref:T9SS type A sorting domain-containing protein n=1 Tax=Emticicia fluvialis TaxID=2974474 RepID=UPI0021650D87|nr:T9SS type A sorting domain-containing protein [Emticicia fluvialis]
MVKTGLLIRMIQDSDRSQAYSIDCKGVNSNVIIAGDIYIDGIKQNSYNQICVEKPFSVTYSATGSFNTDNEYKVFLIAENGTYSVEVGKGTGTMIGCKIPAETPLTSTLYRIQIVSSSPVLHSTLSNAFFYVTKLPSIELSGSYNVFQGEILKIPLKATGGQLIYVLSNNNGYSSTTIIPPTIEMVASRTEVLKVTSVYNSCGQGTAIGQVDINIHQKPIAKSFIIENLNGQSICAGTTIKLGLKADGLFDAWNTFKVQLSDKNGINFKDIGLFPNSINVLEVPVDKNLPGGSNYKVKVISSSPAIEYITQSFTISEKVTASLAGNYVIDNGKIANLKIQFTGTPPFTLTTKEGETISSASNEFLWAVSPTETRTYALKSVTNNSCSNGEVFGNADVKVNYLITTELVSFASVCAGEIVKVPFKVDSSLRNDNGYIVQLSDKTGLNFKNIPTGGTASPLEAIIPNDITEGDEYRLRIISKDGRYIGSGSNQFSIKRKPTAYLEGAVAGNKGVSGSFPVKLTGGGPWTIKLSSGGQESEYTLNQSPEVLPVTVQNSSVYKLTLVSNACGVGAAYGQAVSTIQYGAEKYCMPMVTSGYNAYGKIARVRISDLNGKMLLNSYEMKIGKDRYTDNTGMVAHLKPGNTYTFDLTNSDEGTEYSYWAWGYNLIMWIDYDQNGKFDKNEIIVSNAAFSISENFKVPENAKKGITRMRVRSYKSENLPDNPCMRVDGGETEDYTIYISDDAPQYSASVNNISDILCKTTEQDIYFTATGDFPENNVFRVGLYNSFGNFIGYIGQSKSSPIRIKFPSDLAIGMNYKIRIIATEPYFEGVFSRAFRINDIPNGILSGSQTILLGNKMSMAATVDGGGDWTFVAVNNTVGTWGVYYNKLSLNIPGELMFPVNRPGDYAFKLDRLINSACGDGKITGTVNVKVLEPAGTKASVESVALSDWYIQKCANRSSSIKLSFKPKGVFGENNYFTSHLYDGNDKFVAVLGFSKTNEMIVNLPDNISGFGYKVKVISSNPYFESPASSSLIIAQTPIASISGYSEILPGEQASIKLDFSGPDFGNVGLSDGTMVLTSQGIQIFKVSPATTTTYTVKSVEYYGCMGQVGGSATVKVLQPRASRLTFVQPSAFCIGSVANLSVKKDGSFREKNKFIVKLTNNSRKINKEITAYLADENNLVFNIPTDLPTVDGYNLQIVSTSPYFETQLSESFSIKPISTAVISSETRTVYEKSKVSLRVDFSGEGPYNILLSDRSMYTNITQNPFYIDKETHLRTTRYSIDSLYNGCGNGKASGVVELKVLPLPVITTKAPPAQVICKNLKIYVPFLISNGVFQPGNIFKVETSGQINGTFKEIPTTVEGDSLFIIIPDGIATGTQYIRVIGSNPVIVGSAIPISIKSKPVVEIYGYDSVMAGDTVDFNISHSGDLPWSFKLSNGMAQAGITVNSVYLNYIPMKSEDIFITSASNACGEGTFKGKATYVVHQPEEIESLVKVFPNPYEPNTGLYMDRALLKKNAEVVITDSRGRELKRKSYVRGYMPLDLTEYPSGIYYLRISAYGRQFVRKVVK